MRKRIFAAFVCLCMMMALVPSMAYANDTVYTGGLCEHHTQHDKICGYTEGTAEIPCSHEHTEDCYTLVTKCVHTHTADCYPADDTATPSDAEEKEPVCGHVCSEESGCITKTLDCKHEHDETCGYVPATAGTPCTFVCEVCNAQDSGNPATPSDEQPEECTCETLCTGEEINGDCPVCSAEGAELDKVCIGAALMLPVTALAAAPSGQVIYVGNENVTSGGYWTTDNDGKVTAVTDESTPADNFIHYDANSNILTLHNATIKMSVSIDTNTLLAGAAIGVLNQYGDGNAELTITLEGTNTIANVSHGIYMLANSESTTNSSSLTITGDGSLNASAIQHGIWVQHNSCDAALRIENAKVTATLVDSYGGNGVVVQSAENKSASLTVDGGSLTATGSDATYAGIKMQFGSSTSSSGTPTVTVSGNAIVRANGGITDNSSSEIQIGADSNESNGGIVWNGKDGTVYGNVTLQEDLEIGEGESLTLDGGASLNAGNHNVIVDGGKLDESIANSLGDSVKYAPTIVTPPADKSVTEGETATFTVNATGTEPLSYQWQQSTDNGSSWTNIDSATSDTYTTGKTTMDMSGTQYRCVVENIVKKVTSDAATLTVTAIPTYTITVQTDGHGTASASSTTAKAGKQITLTATPNSGYRFARWEVVLGDITITNNTFTMPAKNVTIKAIFNRKSSGGSVFFWDLKFDTNGGSKIDTVTEWEYSTIDLDEYVPEKEGYKFVGWYADEDLTKKIDEVYLTQDTTVYAKWEKIEEEVPEEPDEVEETEEPEPISFLDVKESDWFYEAVSYAVENGLMSGMSEDIFAPNTPLTREMLAVVLYNVEGQPESTEANTFTDVKGDMWYTDAILWANENGIVAGYDNGAYGVGDLITREQFATILYRYAQFKGYDTTQGGMAVREFSDYENISDYARPAMAWAVNAGIMGGMDDGTLMPQGKATRAEAATMLMNFCENIVK